MHIGKDKLIAFAISHCFVFDPEGKETNRIKIGCVVCGERIDTKQALRIYLNLRPSFHAKARFVCATCHEEINKLSEEWNGVWKEGVYD